MKRKESRQLGWTSTSAVAETVDHAATQTAHLRVARTTLLALLAALFLIFAADASAETTSQGTVTLDQSAYTVSEGAGYLTVTIVRSNPAGDEHVGYGVRRQDAQPGMDFDPVPNTYIYMPPGQSTYSFHVYVHDNGMSAAPVHANVYLYGAWPQPAAAPNSVDMTILRDDPLPARNLANPLGLNPAPIDGNPIGGAPFYVAGRSSTAGQAASQYQSSDPAWSKELSVIANAPGVHRFWLWKTPADPSGVVAHYLQGIEASEPGTVVQLSTYSLVHGNCTGHWADSPAFVQRYLEWVDGLARGIGNFRVVMFFEVDSLITHGCLSGYGLHVRLAEELRPAIARLEQDPHVVLYLDAGAADAGAWQQTANMLSQAGVNQAQGFFVNATHFDWTTSELYYAQRISRRLGGAHFVINTGENGRGPLRPKDVVRQGNEVLCNPPGRGLGPLSTQTGYKWADGFLWFSNPGNSGGACRPGAPPTATFWPAYAAMLAQNRVNRVTGPAYPLMYANGQVQHVRQTTNRRGKSHHKPTRRTHPPTHRAASA